MVIHKVPLLRHALTAERLGVDAVAIVGMECGGHPGANTDMPAMLGGALAAGKLRIPYAIGGGIGHGSQILAALAMGADAVVLGTRFLAGVLNNATAREVRAREAAGRTDYADFAELTRGSLQKEAAYGGGDVEAGMLSMGAAVAFIDQVEPIAAIMDRLMAQAAAAQNRITTLIRS